MLKFHQNIASLTSIQFSSAIVSSQLTSNEKYAEIDGL